MKIYFSGYLTSPELLEVKGNFGILVSYNEIKNKKDFLPPAGHEIFLDSGAFSVFTGKTKIDIKNYADYLNQMKGSYNVYANLDVIGNAAATEKNQKYLEAKGLNPLPTFHYGSDYDILKKMVKKYDYIGLGGLVPLARSKKRLYSHLGRCFYEVRDKVRVHGWGMTGRAVLMKFPFYSVDSTSWLYGGKMRDKYKFSLFSMKGCKEEARVMRYHDLNIHNAMEILKLINFCTKLWQEKGISWER